MIVEFPDHYKESLAVALVGHGIEVILQTGIVPAFVHQYADLWDKGVRFDDSLDYWQALVHIRKDIEQIVWNR